MRLIKTAVAIACIGSAAASLAGPTLGFEDLMKGQERTLKPIDTFYPGISFSSHFYGLVSTSGGGLGQFTPKPGSGAAVAALFNSADPNTPPDGGSSGDVMWLDGKGFGSFLSLSYALGDIVGISASLQLLDRDGKAKGDAISLPQVGYGDPDDPNNPACPILCNWSDIKIEFEGTAFGFRLTGADGLSLFDDISVGDASTNPPGELPEPGSMALVLAGFSASVWGVRRRQTSAA